MPDSVAADTIALIARGGDVVLYLPNGLIWPLGVMTLLGAYLMAHEAVDLVRGLFDRLKRIGS